MNTIQSQWMRLMTAAMVLAACAGVSASDLIAPGAEIAKIGSGYAFTEGPAADKNGDVYFSDIPASRIHKWTHADGKITLFREKTGATNGNYIDRDGNIMSCEGAVTVHRISSTDMKGNTTTIVESYDGKKLNSPNDLWIDPKGGIYFTDPRYGTRADLEQDGEHVYYIPPNRETTIRVANDFERPNGLIGTPDGKTLYVTDNAGGKTWSFKINADGTLTDKTLLIELGSDGMTMDEKGNVYLTTDQVVVVAPDGKKIAEIKFPEVPANVTFGGPDFKTLFVTARQSVYTLKMTVKGTER